MLPDDISLGPLHLQGHAAALLLAAAAGYAAIHMAVRQGGETGKRLLDALGTPLLIWFLVWKFGHVLFDPASAWERPLSLLFFWGGSLELTIGAVAATVALLIAARRRGLNAGYTLDRASVGVIAGLLVYQVLEARFGRLTDVPWAVRYSAEGAGYHPLHVYTLLLCAAALAIWLRRRQSVPGRRFRETTILLGAGLLLISLFAEPDPYLAFLSIEQLAAVLLAVAGFYAESLLRLIDRIPSGHTSHGKEWDEMTTNNSKEQSQQEKENKQHNQNAAQTTGSVDKKLDGPNRPSV